MDGARSKYWLAIEYTVFTVNICALCNAAVAEWVKACDTLTMFEAMRCAGGREFDPRPG